MTRRIRASLGTAALATMAMLPHVAIANPFDYFGFGARAIGLGGAATALSDDFSANHYNPAGLTVRDGLELALGYFAAEPALRLNGLDTRVDPATGTQFGATLRGLALSRKLALSIGLHLPDARITRLRALPELQPRFAVRGPAMKRMAMLETAAEVGKVHASADYMNLVSSHASGRASLARWNVASVRLLGDEGESFMLSTKKNTKACRRATI